jgi:hypothetical protein
VDKAKGRHYQLACALAFEGITGTAHETGINKPTEYYAASVELSKAKEVKAEGQTGLLGGAAAAAAAASPAVAVGGGVR